MTKQEFNKFMEVQIEEIMKYKWIESEKAGRDLGNDCCIEWIKKFAKAFREEYFNNKGKQMINYKDYKNLILKAAWEKKNKYPHLEIDDLIGEGNLIFVKCINNFDNSKNIKFSTYLYKCLVFGLNNYVKVQNNWHRKTVDEKVLKFIPKNCDFKFFELSEDSKKLIKFINNFPEGLKSKKKKITKQTLSYIMHNNCHYAHKEIKSIFAEIKECLI